jgi:thiamine pyrophosphokinase
LAVQGRAPQTAVADFDDLLVIVGGGEVDLELLTELYASGGRLVGADAGADTIVAAGLKPEVIIGDFDSLRDPLSWLGKTRLMQLAEQETTRSMR